MPQEEPIEDDVAREMTVPVLDIRELMEIKPRLTEDQLDGLTQANRGMVLSVALIEERQIEVIKLMALIFNHLRHVEANQIRDRKATKTVFESLKVLIERLNADSVKLTGWALVMKWAAMLVGGGTIAALVTKGINKLWK